MPVVHGDSPPGWYPDPGGTADQRYWDGETWTQGVVIDGEVSETPLPPEPVDPDRRADLPAVAAAWAVAAVCAGIVGAALVALAVRALTDSEVLVLIVGQAVLWTAMLAPVIVASRRYGSGSLVRDYQLCWRGSDVALGVPLSLLARVAATAAAVVAILATGADPDAFPNQIELVADERAALYIACAFAVLGAPIIEELFFRGLLQRSLQPSLGAVGAIATQGILFGLAHITTATTWQHNAVLTAMLTAVGVVAGILVHTTKRLTPSMWLHLFFNVLGVTVVVSQL